MLESRQPDESQRFIRSCASVTIQSELNSEVYKPQSLLPLKVNEIRPDEMSKFNIVIFFLLLLKLICFCFPSCTSPAGTKSPCLHANGMRETATTGTQCDRVSLGSVGSNNSPDTPYAERPIETMCCVSGSQWWSSWSVALTGLEEHTSLAQPCCQQNAALSYNLSSEKWEGKKFWQGVNCVCETTHNVRQSSIDP